MAELFSLMLKFTSCENDRVEANCTQARPALPALLQEDAPATGEISRDARSTKLCARRETISRFALEMTPDPGFVSFRARASTPYRVVLAAMSDRDREESRPQYSHAFSFWAGSVNPLFSVAADGPSAIGESGVAAQKGRKFDDRKKLLKRTHSGKFSSIYKEFIFLQLEKIPNEPTAN